MDKTTAPKSAIGFLIGWSAEFLRRSKFHTAAWWIRQPRPMHYWRVEYLPMLPHRLGNRQYCLDKAVECDRKAAQARDPNAAKEFHPSPHAGAWAATRDFNHKVEDILRTLREAASS